MEIKPLLIPLYGIYEYIWFLCNKKPLYFPRAADETSLVMHCTSHPSLHLGRALPRFGGAKMRTRPPASLPPEFTTSQEGELVSWSPGAVPGPRSPQQKLIHFIPAMVPPAPPPRPRRNGTARPPFRLPPPFPHRFRAKPLRAGRGRSVPANQRRQRGRAPAGGPIGARGGGGGARAPVRFPPRAAFCREKVGGAFRAERR